MFRSTEYRDYARIDIGNAIAAIEGQIAHPVSPRSRHLRRHRHQRQRPDHRPRAPDLRRQLGDDRPARGRGDGPPARRHRPDRRRRFTFFGEQADQPDVLQRRFNFFDFASDGQLNGMITIDQFKLLAHNLLPLPDQYTIVDRQRASANGFLLDPEARAQLQGIAAHQADLPVRPQERRWPGTGTSRRASSGSTAGRARSGALRSTRPIDAGIGADRPCNPRRREGHRDAGQQQRDPKPVVTAPDDPQDG